VTDINGVIYPAAMQTYFIHTYESHPSGLWGDSVDFMGLKQLCVSRNILFGFESHPGHGCLSVVSVVRQRSLRRADHSSRGVLPTVVRLCV